MSAEHVCARCPKHHGRSCCEPEEGEQLATLTAGDIERISAATNQPPSRFVEEEWLTHEEAFAYERFRPLFRGYFARESKRLTLRRGKAGACVFHRPQTGCALEAEVRPLACRLYPFELLADGTWSLATGDDSACLAVEESEDLSALLQLMGLSEHQLETWASELKAASRAHGSYPRRR